MNRSERDQLWEQMRSDGWEYGEMLGSEGGGYAILIGDISRIFHTREEYDEFMQALQSHHKREGKGSTNEDCL